MTQDWTARAREIVLDPESDPTQKGALSQALADYAKVGSSLLALIEPGAMLGDVRVIKVNIVPKEGHMRVMLVIRGERIVSKTKRDSLVVFHRATTLASAVFELDQRVDQGKLAWREDTPFESSGGEAETVPLAPPPTF